MDNWTVFQKWGGGMIFLIATYDVLLNQLAPQDIRDKYLLYSFGWSWQTWTIILLGSLVVTYWWNNRQKENKANTTSHTQTSNRGGVSQQSGRDSLSNSNNTIVERLYLGSEDRTKNDLRHQIGIELQVFGSAFHDIAYAHYDDLRETYDKANHILEKLTSDLFYRANLLLTDTPIPEKLVELRKYYDQYSLDLFIHHSVEGKIRDYIIKSKSKKRLRIPDEMEEQKRHLRISIDTNQLMVQYIVKDILELCKE